MKLDLKKAFKTVNDAIDGIVNVGFAAILGVILLGSVVYAVVSGNIPLSSNYNTTLNSLDSTSSAWFDTSVLSVNTIVALIIVVVLVALFGYAAYSSGKKKGAY